MINATPSPEREFIAEVMYNTLLSTDKSEDFSTKYLRMDIKKRRLSQQEVRKIAYIYADLLIQRVGNSGIEISAEQKRTITIDCLHRAMEQYDRDNHD